MNPDQAQLSHTPAQTASRLGGPPCPLQQIRLPVPKEIPHELQRQTTQSRLRAHRQAESWHWHSGTSSRTRAHLTVVVWLRLRRLLLLLVPSRWSVGPAVAEIGARGCLVYGVLGHVAILGHCKAAGIRLLHGVHCRARHHLALLQHASMRSLRPQSPPLLPALPCRVLCACMMPCAAGS